MINVKPTANHIKNIKKHKKFLEKWKMWEFAYSDGHDFYFVVHYTQITGGITGYLILNKEGEDLPFEQIESPAHFLMWYNTMVHNTITDIAPQMKKSMKPFQEMYELLTKNKSGIVRIRPDLLRSLDEIIHSITKSLEQPEAIREIVYTLGGYQRQVTREKGYFDQKFLKVMDDEIGKYGEMMYQNGLRERELRGDYELVYQALNNGEFSISHSDQKKLQGLLKANMESNDNALEKSLETFEKDDQGHKLFIDRNNIKESLSKNRIEQGKIDFYKEIVPIIRNIK